ncbi:MAG: hypothetical protein JSU68_12505 [Phycisphaerales bacterium]|nr:MAG: hypothetical protein JSU68_12505 [Phycisphaerales bacterium]
MKEARSVEAGRRFQSQGLVYLAVAGTLALLLAHAAHYLFLCDDAFISFRYARNLAEGHGLVFNPGHERVEGYTNFLWVLLLAAFDVVGLIPEKAAHVLSIAATVGLWAVVVWFSVRSCPRDRTRWLCLIAPLFLAATRSVAVWSTSGLETRLFEFLVVAGVLRLIVENEGRVADQPRRNLGTFLLALATLTRPDALLISALAFACAGLHLLYRRRLDVRAFGAQAGWYVLIVGAHFAFRLIYYGEWLPNTYYTKVGGRTWWDMGFVYLGLFTIEYAAYLWIPLIVAAIAEHRRRKTPFTPALFAAVVIPHALYVTSIGGDHFEYRPIDLYFPFLFILFADGAARLARSTAATVATGVYLLVVLVGLAALPYQTHRQFPDIYRAGFPGMVANSAEAREYLLPENDPVYGLPGPRSLLRGYRRLLWDATEHFVGVRQEEHRLFLASVVPEGRHLRRLVEAGLLPADAHIAIACAGAIPYYSRLRVLDRLGLTDAEVARSEFREGERAMAHDKRATYDYARQAGVDFWSFDKAHSLIHVTDPLWVRHILRVTEQRLDVYVADVGDGYYLLGHLPQGAEHAAARFPKLDFRLLRDQAVAWSIIQRAIDALRAKLAGNPGDDETRMLLADTLLFTRQAAVALDHYRILLPRHPDDPRLLYNVSIALLYVGQPTEAVSAAERGLALARAQGDESMIAKLSDQLADSRAALSR